MIIERMETYSNEALCVVKVYTDDGVCGVGQTAPFDADITALIVHRRMAPIYLGKDPLRMEDLSREAVFGASNHKFIGSHLYRALAGVDTALWDIAGKVAGQPLPVVCLYAASDGSHSERRTARGKFHRG